MKFEKTTLSLAILLAMSFVSTGCGGSGGSSGSSDNNQAKVETTDVNVQIIDGYLKDSKVCADINRNYICDVDEPNGVTDENGKVTIKIPKDVLKQNNSIKIISHTPKGSGNKILGKDSVTDRDIVLTSNIFIDNNGVPKENNTVTPFTTLVDSTFKQSAIQDLKEEVYKEVLGKLAEALGLDKSLIDKDYNDPQSVSQNPNLLKNLVAGELIVRNDLIPKSLDDAKNMTEETVQTTDSIVNNVEEYKEIIQEVATTTDVSNIENIGEVIANKITDIAAKLGTSFRTITSGDADEWRCGVTRSNNIFCWGNNSSGILGDPDLYRYDDNRLPLNGWSEKDLFSAKPVSVKTSEKNADGSYKLLGNVKNVSASNGHACAVTNSGEVYCWGQNFHGQLGNGTIGKLEDGTAFGLVASKVVKGEQNKDDASVKYLQNIESVTSAHNVSCALSRDGEVYCWGDNTAKQLGGDHVDDQTEPYKDVLSTDNLSMYGFIKVVPHPVKVNFPKEVKKVTKLTSGIWAFCATTELSEDDKSNQNLYCWGNDTTGLVTNNDEQYEEDFERNYAGKLRNKAGGGYISSEDHWNWRIYEQSGEWYPLYGAPVTKVELSYNDTISDSDETIYNFKKENITDIKISNFDSSLLMLDEKNSVIFRNSFKGNGYVYYWIEASSKRINGEKIKKMQIDSEAKHKLVISDAGKLYSFSGYNRHGDLGNGTSTEENASTYYELPVVLDSDGQNVLTGVMDLAVNKRSVCATVAVTDTENPQDNKVAVKYDLYCWGSTTFGQNGYDNGFNGFSYSDTSKEWTGTSDENIYFDDTHRYDKSPRLVTFFDKE